MGPNGLFYANAVGSFGVVSAGQNWGRLSIAVHRRALKLVDKQKVFLLLFPTTHFLSGRWDLRRSFLNKSVFLMILWYPCIDGEFWVKNELVWIVFSLDATAQKCGICEEKRRLTLEKAQLLSKLKALL